MTVLHASRVADSRPRERMRPAGKSVIILTTLLAAAAAFSVPSSAEASNYSIRNGLFLTAEKRSSKLSAFTKWNGVLRRYYRESRRTAHLSSIRRWKRFIRSARHLSRREQIVAVNRYVNRFEYRTDYRNYGVADYWATPRQFFARGGDCEDFAIVKYLTLKALGWRQSQLRLVVLIDRRKRQAHAVLAVYHAGRRHILDNQFRRVMRDTQIAHYRPVYSINERSWWFHMDYQTAAR